MIDLDAIRTQLEDVESGFVPDYQVRDIYTTDIAALLAEVERLREQVTRLDQQRMQHDEQEYASAVTIDRLQQQVATDRREGAIEAMEQLSEYFEGAVPLRYSQYDDFGSGIEQGYQKCIEHIDERTAQLRAEAGK